MSQEQDNHEAYSQASQDSPIQMDYAGSEDQKQYEDQNSDSEKNSDKNKEQSDDDDDQYDLEEIHEETPDWRKKWEFQKSKFSVPVQKRLLKKHQRMTSPIITKHEYAKIIGLRAKQIYAGAALYHMPPEQLLKQPNMIKIAQQQLKFKATPFVIERRHSNGDYELWQIEQLQQ